MVRGTALVLLSLALPALAAESRDAEQLIDPMAPIAGLRSESGEIVSPGASLRLNSVLVRPDRRIAVINAQRVSEGGRIGNATVVSIEMDRVWVESAGELRELRLHRTSIKTPRTREAGE